MNDLPLIAITGASSGIGAAAARAFSEEGYPLLLMARRGDRMKAMNLPNAIVAEVDVTDSDAVRDAIEKAESEFGPVDLLINNAGVMPLGTVDDQLESEIRMIFEVNCVALLLTTKLVLPQMRERRHGTIMNVGSIAGEKLYDNHTVYCASKFAVHALTDGLRAENADRGVRVTLIAPGQVETELLSLTRSKEIVSDYLHYRDSIGGGLQPEDIADAMVYAYKLPQSVSVREIVLTPTSQGN